MGSGGGRRGAHARVLPRPLALHLSGAPRPHCRTCKVPVVLSLLRVDAACARLRYPGLDSSGAVALMCDEIATYEAAGLSIFTAGPSIGFSISLPVTRSLPVTLLPPVALLLPVTTKGSGRDQPCCDVLSPDPGSTLREQVAQCVDICSTLAHQQPLPCAQGRLLVSRGGCCPTLFPPSLLFLPSALGAGGGGRPWRGAAC